MAQPSEIDRMYRRVADAPDTEARMQIFEHCGFPLTDLDNYETIPGSDPVFETSWHRWLHLFQLTTGVERASVMAIAFELHRSTSNPLLMNVGFFSHGFSDSTRDMYYAKAMCLANRKPVYDMEIES